MHREATKNAKFLRQKDKEDKDKDSLFPLEQLFKPFKFFFALFASLRLA